MAETGPPQGAIDAAAGAITRSLAEDYPDTWMESDELLARAALAAAAPHLAADALSRFADDLEAVGMTEAAALAREAAAAPGAAL